MIEKDIDRAERRIKRIGLKVESTESEIELLRLADNPGNAEQIIALKEDVKSLQGKISRLRDTRLVKLKYTLASFQTQSLPGIEVNSVVLQPK